MSKPTDPSTSPPNVAKGAPAPAQRNPPATTPRVASPPAAPQRRVTGFYASLDPSRTQKTVGAQADGLPSRRTVDLVQASWAKVMPISDAAASLFYARLFELDPTVKPLFKSDMGEQKKKLMQTLTVAVDGLSNIPKLVPVLQALGARHAGYMVQDHHYDVVGEALLWTLREGLGDDFTDEVEGAWKEIYTLVADVMKKAAASHTGASGGARTPAQPLPLAQVELQREAPRAARGRGVVAPVPAPIPPPPESQPLAGRTLVGISAPAQEDGGGPSRQTIDLVQASWAKVMPISDAAASLFYDRLFELEPSVKPLFKNDMGEQKKKLMQTLTVAVDGLRNLPKLVPVLQALGVRHAGYMVQDHHYDVVGAALLWTLREGLGDDFTDEVEDAWKEIYTLVADVMKKAAAEHTGARAGAGAAPRSARSASEVRSDPPVEDLVATLHYESSKKPALDADGLDEPEHEYAPDVAAPRQVPAGYAPAYAPAYGPQAPPVGGIVVPLSGQEVTLNVRVNVDAPPTLMARGATAVEPPPQGGLAPALFLSVLCVVASMALTVMGPSFGARGDTAGAFVVPLGVLLLTGAAFGLGYQWGRGRRASGSDARR